MMVCLMNNWCIYKVKGALEIIEYIESCAIVSVYIRVAPNEYQGSWMLFKYILNKVTEFCNFLNKFGFLTRCGKVKRNMK